MRWSGSYHKLQIAHETLRDSSDTALGFGRDV
jgi:hypothetical protein